MNEISSIPDVDETYRPDIKEGIESMPAAKLIGLRVIGFSPVGISRLEARITHDITTNGRMVQGGILGMVADYAGVSAVACMLESGWVASTTAFEVHNLAPATGEKIVAIGRAVKVGKSIGVSTAEIYSASNGKLTLTCIATTTCKPMQLVK
jgi:uncharacterized protein (TIGR00369 family)